VIDFDRPCRYAACTVHQDRALRRQAEIPDAERRQIRAERRDGVTLYVIASRHNTTQDVISKLTTTGASQVRGRPGRAWRPDVSDQAVREAVIAHRNGVSPASIARKLCVHRVSVWNWIRGKTRRDATEGIRGC
jgi:hypothetical protein